jgi:hypothetical protein
MKKILIPFGLLSVFLTTGCVTTVRTTSYVPVYHNQSVMVSYTYQRYEDRPFYYLKGVYYYGGLWKNNCYFWNGASYCTGHYYADNYRYYNGVRYRPIRGEHGYYKTPSHHHKPNLKVKEPVKLNSHKDVLYKTSTKPVIHPTKKTETKHVEHSKKTTVYSNSQPIPTKKMDSKKKKRDEEHHKDKEHR